MKCIAFLIVFVQMALSQPNMCGTPQPDPMKTCVSVRLPWQPEPMYFCMEKEKFKYRSACMGQMNNCGMNNRDDTLLVATPWDCCPMVSVPDHCMNAWCPPKPMNRECKLLEMDNGMYGDCCQKYFCEAESTPENCHLMQIKPECNSPPKDKMNCVAFYDMYGCCTKYQCQGEGKPGMCPMEARMKNFNDRMNGSIPMAPPPPPAGDAPATRSEPFVRSSTSTLYPQVVPAPMGMNSKITILTRTHQPHAAEMSMFPDTYATYHRKIVPCINDNNCEGNQKCCSNDMSVYANGPYTMRNMHPTNGYCTEPVM